MPRFSQNAYCNILCTKQSVTAFDVLVLVNASNAAMENQTFQILVALTPQLQPPDKEPCVPSLKPLELSNPGQSQSMVVLPQFNLTSVAAVVTTLLKGSPVELPLLLKPPESTPLVTTLLGHELSSVSPDAISTGSLLKKLPHLYLFDAQTWMQST